MGGGCSNRGRDGNVQKFNSENLKGRNLFEGVGLYRRIRLKWISRE
jgi:hypothetical protein